MWLVFFETPLFTRLLPEYLDDEGYRALQKALLQNPDLGVLMPATGGFRMLRRDDRRRGKGKRGGLRVVYYHMKAERRIWLFTLYDKDEMADLTPDEKRALRAAIQVELAAARQEP
jgi:hypothetical protein